VRRVVRVKIKKEVVERSCFDTECGKKSINFVEVKSGDFTFHVPFCPNPSHRERAKKHAKLLAN
jgi:hypothetical protein